MKKLINDPENVVREELSGIARAHRDLVEVHFDPHYIVRADAPSRGRSPSSRGAARATSRCTAGSSGMGMLDAACPGEVFTSPTPDQMEAATKAVDGGAGVVHIVKNYTGDVMNFEMAAELVPLGGHRGRVRARGRRRGRAGLAVHGGAARRRRHGPDGEDRRRAPPRSAGR